MRESLTEREAFAVTIELFKGVQAENEQLKKKLDDERLLCKMKQDDWIEACKEIDRLREALTDITKLNGHYDGGEMIMIAEAALAQDDR
jgi:hypothetical protein